MRPKYTGFAVILLLLLASAQGCATSDEPGSEPTELNAPTASTTGSTTTTTLSQAEVALSGMTLREKAAQVLLLTFSGTALQQETSSLLAAGPPGGLLILGHNVVDPEQMQSLTSALQQTAAATGSPVALFIAVDQEGGRVQRIKQDVPVLASARDLGSDSTPDAAYYLATETARGLLNQGVNMNLAPVADVVADKSSFLYGRTYSGDPSLVSEFVTAVVEAHLEQGLISVVKHFPGHGSASGNTHTEGATSGATKQDYESVHLAPFRAAISAGVEGVMTAHIVAAPYDPLHPATLSSAVIEGLLRGELGFEGLVVADDVSMAAALDSVASVASSPTTSSQTGTSDTPELTEKQIKEQLLIAKEVRVLVAALNAGCDLLILTELETRAQAVLDGLVAAIEQGDVSQARLDEAVLQILDLKYRHDLVAQEASSLPATTTTATTTQPPEKE